MPFAFERQNQVGVTPGQALPSAPRGGFSFERGNAPEQPTGVPQEAPVAVPNEAQDEDARYQELREEYQEDVGLLDTFYKNYHAGGLQHEQAKTASVNAMRVNVGQDPDPAIEAELDYYDRQLELLNLGEDAGWSSLRGMAQRLGNFFGQQVSILGSETVLAGTTGGTVVGGAAGLAGGPLAPVTVTGGAIVGAKAGFFGSYASETAASAIGSTYLEARQAGVSEDTAAAVALPAGILIGSLDMVSVVPGSKFVTEPVKELVASVIKDEIKKGAASVLAKVTIGMGKNMAREGLTEGMQEVIQIGAVEIGRQLEGMDPNGIDTPENRERVIDALMTGMLVAGVASSPGVGTHLIQHYGEAQLAKKNQLAMDAQAQQLQKSTFARREPDAAARHFHESMIKQGRDKVWIPADRLTQWIAQSSDPAQMTVDLGVARHLADILATPKEDVAIRMTPFAKNILLSDRYSDISDHIRVEEGAMTPYEAREWEESGLKEDLQDSFDTLTEEGADMSPEVTLAETELGLRGLFRSAHEAGMSDGEYSSYLTNLQKGRWEAQARQIERDLKRDQAELSKKWKQELQLETIRAEEHLKTEVLAYRSMDNIQRDRLDAKAVREVLHDLGIEERQIPTQTKGRKLWGSGGIDPNIYAEEQGYRNAHAMLWDWALVKDRKEAAQALALNQLREKHGHLEIEINRIAKAREDLFNRDHRSALEQELAALRKQAKLGAIKSSVLRAEAIARLDKLPMKEARFSRMMHHSKRAGFEARKLLRKGDRKGAANAKAQQLIYFEMGKQAIKIEDRKKRDLSFLRGFEEKKAEGKMPTNHLSAIRQLLSHVGLRPVPTEAQMKKLTAIANSTTDPAKIPKRFLDAKRPLRWEDMTAGDFRDLVNTVKEIQWKGRMHEKFYRAEEAARVQQRVDDVVFDVKENLPKLSKGELRALGWWDNTSSAMREVLAGVWTASTHLELMGKNSYNALKKPLDEAMNHGYHKGQVGYLRRSRAESKKLTELFNKHFSDKDKKRLSSRNEVNVPGFGMVQETKRLALLLNVGNEGNLDVLRQKYSEGEIQAIIDSASKRDLDFAQDVWDYMDSFWGEIVEASQRRRNITPEKVAPRKFSTPHGEYRGGYYPIRYDPKTGSTLDSVDEQQQVFDHIRRGHFVASHTKQGHLEARQGSEGRELLLDLFVINSHVDTVIRDLELSDALTDIYKVLQHADTKNALRDQGHYYRWEQLDMWYRDAVTGEMFSGAMPEKFARHLRTGATIAAIGFKLSTAALQILGVANTAGLIGKRNMWQGVKAFSKAKKLGNDNIYQWVQQQSGFMEGRYEEFNKDILDAKREFRLNWADRKLPGRSADLWRDALFWPIKKMQQQTDTITWLAGYHKGLREGMGHGMAVREADRVVAESQSSSVFTERSAWERGRMSRTTGNQSEFVRMWTLLSSYFIAKNNVVRRRAARVGSFNPFKNPMGVLNFAVDFMLMFPVEALLSVIIRKLLDPSAAEEEHWEDLPSEIMWDVGGGIVAGFPVAKEAVSAMRGFSGGGTVGGYTDKISRLTTELGDDELDIDDVQALNNAAGPLLHYPSGAINNYVLKWFDED